LGGAIDGEGYLEEDLEKFLHLLDERFSQFHQSSDIPKELCWLLVTALAAFTSPERQYSGMDLERMDDAYGRLFTAIEIGLFPPSEE
jgi:hypothetical protein